MKRLALFVLLVAFGCADAPPADEPARTPAATTKTAAVDVAPPSKSEATRPSKTKTASATDPLAKTLEGSPGDLVVVFTNNVDGEIEPCG